MDREKPGEYWFPGPLSSALASSESSQILSWDEVGYARLLEEWTGGTRAPECENACLTFMGMTAPVLGSVLIGKRGPIKRGLCVCVPRVGCGCHRSSWIKVTVTRCPAVFWFMLQGVDPPCNKRRPATLARLVGCCV